MSAVLDDVIAAAQLVPLSQAVEVNPKLDRSLLNDDLDVSFVPMAAVEALSGGIDVSTVRKYGEVKKGYTHFRDGDILFAKVTPCMENGKMAIARKLVNGVGFGSTEFHVLRPRAGVDARYIYYFVSSQTFRKEASGHMTGAVGLRRVPSAYLEEQLILLPGIEQQREIVAELEKQFSRLDEAVANLQRVKANLKRYKASVLKDAVEGRLVPTEAELARREGRSFETGEQLLQRILEVRRKDWSGRGKYEEPMPVDAIDLPACPVDWTWATVGQVGFIRGGKRLPAGHTYAKEETDFPYIRVTDFVDYGVREAELLYLDAATQNEIKRYTISCDDVYISIAGSIGLVGQVPAHLSGANLTENAAKITELRHISQKYLTYWLSSASGIGFISESTIATTQSKLALYRIEKIPLPLPPQAEQLRIVAEVDRRLSLVRGIEREVDANLKRTQALRQSTLAKAFS